MSAPWRALLRRLRIGSGIVLTVFACVLAARMQWWPYSPSSRWWKEAVLDDVPSWLLAFVCVGLGVRLVFGPVRALPEVGSPETGLDHSPVARFLDSLWRDDFLIVGLGALLTVPLALPFVRHVAPWLPWNDAPGPRSGRVPSWPPHRIAFVMGGVGLGFLGIAVVRQWRRQRSAARNARAPRS